MKFPKSVHADGWLDHVESTQVNHLPDALKDGGNAPLSAPTTTRGIPTPGAQRTAASMAGTPVSTRIDPNAPLSLDARPQPYRADTTTAALPPQRENKLSWAIGAGAGVAIIAAIAAWSMHKPAEQSGPPPAVLTGSAAPETQVAAATPTDTVAAASTSQDATPSTDSTPTTATAAKTDSAPTTVAEAKPAEPAPAKLGPPVTTVKPAAEPKAMAQAAPAPAPAPRMAALTPRPEALAQATPPVTRTLQPQPDALTTPQAPTTIAAAPTTTPQALPEGSVPITMPPTAAGPLASATTPQPMPPATTPEATPPAVTPQATTPPVAAATPSTQVAPASPAAPVVAQAAVEDTGITVKVKTVLATDTVLAAVPIAVTTNQGIVKLEGQAPDAQAREHATAVVASTAGVKGVDNRLTLPPVAQMDQPRTVASGG
jgi:hypothetical protein